ncbi:MAG TPA: guanitoxin biosynthesis PLP-dependent transaminase GntE [Herpetosiphonaceae bacterium]
MDNAKTRAAYAKARSLMPYGVSSNFRYWGNDATPVISRGDGGCVYDADGNEYIDYRLGFGPVILGHGHPAVVERVQQAITGGTCFALTSEWEIRAAEKLLRMLKWPDLMRWTTSGTEATMHAIRIARAHTGRERILKFEGNYHGNHDYLLFSTAGAWPGSMGSRRSPIAVASTSGIPRHLTDYVLTLPYNDIELLETTVARAWHDLAAIIVEPVMGNCAGITPDAGFLETIRRLCDEHGIVMILDEVKTGFRIANGGAVEVYGVTPDIATYAKALGNGFPVAAIAGRRAVMETIVPGQVLQGGTYCGNAVGVAAADAVLDLLEREPVLDRIAAQGRRLMQGLDEILSRAAIPHHLLGHGAMFGLVLSEAAPREHRDWARTDRARYEHLMLGLVQRGVMPDLDSREPWFLCAAHDDELIARTLEVFEAVVKTL